MRTITDSEGRTTHLAELQADRSWHWEETLCPSREMQSVRCGTPEEEAQWDEEERLYRESAELAHERWLDGECCGLRCGDDGVCCETHSGWYAHPLGVEIAKRNWDSIHPESEHGKRLSPWQRAACIESLTTQMEVLIRWPKQLLDRPVQQR